MLHTPGSYPPHAINMVQLPPRPAAAPLCPLSTRHRLAAMPPPCPRPAAVMQSGHLRTSCRTNLLPLCPRSRAGSECLRRFVGAEPLSPERGTAFPCAFRCHSAKD